jgi:hypothetical protein
MCNMHAYAYDNVCIYVCMYVYMYCMYVCMRGCAYGCSVRVGMLACTCVHVYVCTRGCMGMYGCMSIHARMYVRVEYWVTYKETWPVCGCMVEHEQRFPLSIISKALSGREDPFAESLSSEEELK